MIYKNFKTYYFIITLNLLIVSCSSKRIIKDEAKDQLEYKIIKIDSTSKIYIISARRNSSSDKKIKQTTNINSN